MSVGLRFEVEFVCLVALAVFSVEAAAADCCALKKLETESETHVRVCAPNAESECARVLFEGSLRPGEEQTVCAEQGEVIYQEFDPETNAFGAMARATCAENEIEL